MRRSSSFAFERRQGYGAVTSGLTQASDSLTDSASGATSSLSKPQIVGVVVAIIALAALAVGLTWYCCVRSAKRRDRRHAQEQEEIRQRERASQPGESTWRIDPSHGSVTVGVPMAAMAHDHFHNPHRRGSEPVSDDDHWNRDPLTLADGSRQGGYIGSGFVVDFDTQGQPQYHNQPSTDPQQHHLPSYGERSPALTPTERQPMYAR